MTQHLTYPEVLAAARAAYNAGTLLALVPHPGTCRYHTGKYRCAIGAALTDETLAKIDEKGLNTEAVFALVDKGIIEIETEHYLHINRLQTAHDNCISYKDNPKILQKFLAILNEPMPSTKPEEGVWS